MNIFKNNKIQAIRFLVGSRFPESVKKIVVHILDKTRVLLPIENTWDNFFLSKDGVSDDFMAHSYS